MTVVGTLRRRLPAARHKAYVHVFSRFAPYYLVNEFPKSGGTFLAQMLAELLDLPFRRNAPIRFERSVTHGHFLRPWGLGKVVVIWRDPRDLLVSFYHHCYFVNEHHNAALVAMMKHRLPFADYEDVRGNLPAFIRFVSATPVTPRFTWPEFAKAWLERPSAIHTSYERLRDSTPAELSRIACELSGGAVLASRAAAVADAHRFDRVKASAEAAAAAKAGVEKSFVREGSMGGWRKHFTTEAEAELSAAGYAEPMMRLGYGV